MKPILFSTPMVQAILENRKTMTRRVIKLTGKWVESFDLPKPKYEPGDILWVRETWCDVFGRLEYRADFSESKLLDRIARYGKVISKWRPSIFMPKEAARLYLRVTDVRVERLQDITEEDAKAEGIEPRFSIQDQFSSDIARLRFSELWDDINGGRGYWWYTNPWVWVYSFERCEKPQEVEK